MRITPQQVQKALEAHRERMSELESRVDHTLATLDDAIFYFEFADQLQFTKKPVELQEVGTAKLVAYERSNDKLEIVFSLGEQLFCINGYASSYEADEWKDEATEVVAHEKTITVYEEVTHGK
jgi:sugar diacid utilization regulator